MFAFDDSPEPSAWQVQTSDNTAGLQQPGGVGVTGYISSTTTNSPVVIGIDNFEVRSILPQ